MVWLVVVVVLAIGAGVYLYRRSASTGSSAARPATCPHLGLADDPRSFLRFPTPEHRCYLNADGERVDVINQMSFCLTAEHHRCPWLALYTPEPPGSRWEEIVQLIQEEGWPMARHALLVVASGLVSTLQSLIGGAVRRTAASDGRPSPRPLAAEGAVEERRGLVGGLRAELAHLAGVIRQARAEEEVLPSVELASVPADSGGVNPQELVLRGRAALQSGRRKVAYGYFVQCTELVPEYLDGWLWRSATAPNAVEARQCLEHLLSLDPSNGRARAALAMLERRGEQPVEPTTSAGPGKPLPVVAIATPGGAQTRLVTWSCATCRAENRVSDLLCHHCGASVYGELGPGPEAPLLRQGLAALQAGDEDAAYRLFVSATETRASSELAWQLRGRTAETLEELARCLERVLEINPANARAKADLTATRQRLGWQEAARRRAAERPKSVRSKRPSPLAWALPAFGCLALAALWTLLARSATLPTLPIELDLPLQDLGVKQPMVVNLFVIGAAGIGLMDLFIALALATRSSDGRAWALWFAVGTVALGAFYRVDGQLLPQVLALWGVGLGLLVALLITRAASGPVRINLEELDQPRSEAA